MEEQKSHMNKIIVVSLILIVLLFAGWRLTGNVVSNDRSVVDVTRALVTNDPYVFTKNVVLVVSSSENVLAIEEGFIGDNCYVVEYEVNPEMDIAQFNSTLTLWVIGNRSSNLVFILSYSIPDNCVVNVSAGMVYTLEGNQIIGPVANDPGNTGGGSTGGGGSSGASGGTTGGGTGRTIPVEMSSTSIVQAKDDADFKKLIITANNRLAAFTDESGGKSDSFYVYAVIGIILVFIMGFVVLIIVTRPKDYSYSDKNLQKFKDEFMNQRTTN